MTQANLLATKKLILLDHVPVTARSPVRPTHPVATRPDAFIEAHRKRAGPSASGWVYAETRWQSDIWDRTLPINTLSGL